MIIGLGNNKLLKSVLFLNLFNGEQLSGDCLYIIVRQKLDANYSVWFYKHGHKTREAEQHNLRDVNDKLYVHSDGVQLYKCYDVGELIVG